MKSLQLALFLIGLCLYNTSLLAFQPIPRVGDDGVQPPVFTHRIAPEYPAEAIASGVQGYVIMEAVLGEDGNIRDVQVLRDIGEGDLGFADAARDALMAWEYKPGQINGVPSDVRMTVKIDFQLDYLRLKLLHFDTVVSGQNLAEPTAVYQNVVNPNASQAKVSLPITLHIAADGQLINFDVPEELERAFGHTTWLLAAVERRINDLTFKPARNRDGGLETTAIFLLEIPLSAAP